MATTKTNGTKSSSGKKHATMLWDSNSVYKMSMQH